MSLGPARGLDVVQLTGGDVACTRGAKAVPPEALIDVAQSPLVT